MGAYFMGQIDQAEDRDRAHAAGMFKGSMTNTGEIYHQR